MSIPQTQVYYVTTVRERDGRLDRVTYETRKDAWRDVDADTIISIHEITIWDTAKLTAQDITEDVAKWDVWDALDDRAHCDESIPDSWIEFISNVTGLLWQAPGNSIMAREQAAEARYASERW